MKNIGIDLGTTHSLVAAVLSKTPRCFLDDDGRALLPSAVEYNEKGEPVAIGYDALSSNSGKSITSVKRLMGRTPKDIPDCLYPYDTEEDRVFRLRVGKKTVTPMEVSAQILKSLVDRAEECLFEKPTGAVITVPAYFDDAQRQATKDAAKIAGLDVLRLLNEPTAAALAYGLQEGKDGVCIAIYDLGGGTFDISILELNEGVFEVKATAGDTQLGGDDFDRAIADALLQSLGFSDLEQVEYRRLIASCRSVKHALTELESTTISFRGHEVEFDRESFEHLIRPIVTRTGGSCRQALSDAGLTLSDIDELVLVGGSTRVPLVRSYVAELFNIQPHTDLDPDQVVALGAAIQADILSGTSEIAEDVLLLDVLPLSLGLEVMGGVVERLIPRCSPIPTSASQSFTTHVDGQGSVKIHIVQGEREMVQDNRSLATFSLSGLPNLPAGVPRVRVSFMVDADGILNVRAQEEFTKVEASVNVQPSYGIDDDEIEQMLEDAIDNAATDVEQRMLIEAKIEAEQILHALKKALEVDGAMATEAEKTMLLECSDQLASAVQDEERKKISDLSRRLDEISAPFAQRRIERDLALALEGRTVNEVQGHLGVD
jgi:molecular chaperone HscA